jgi:hypothetical protein
MSNYQNGAFYIPPGGEGSDANGNTRGAGTGVLAALTTGIQDTAAGFQALAADTTGQQNTAFGYGALAANQTGSFNVAIGDHALANCTVSSNTAVGSTAGQAITTGGFNIAIGTGALKSNQTGANNVAIGYNALEFSTNFNNIAVGYQALHNAVGGAANIAIGTNALQSVTSGSNNVAFGYQAGYTATPANACVAGIGNTLIGLNTGAGTTADPSYTTCLGYTAQCDASGGVAIGTDHTGAGAHSTAQDVIALGTANHQIQIKNNTTGAGSALLGANSPAVTLTAPYTWFKLMSSDGSTVYVPAWK